MIRIGEYNELRVARLTRSGLFLTDGEQDVLLPGKHAPAVAETGETLRVFVHTDSEDRVVATTQKPLAAVGEFAPMRVVDARSNGAFVDWGLDKDLFVPRSEQRRPMVVGQLHVVRVLLDEVSNRPIGTTRLSAYLEDGPGDLKPGEPVDLIVYHKTSDGALVVIDGRYRGLLPGADAPGPVRIGDRRRGFVNRIREDGKIAVTLFPVGHRAVMDEAPRIVEMLQRAGGFLPYGDGATPEEIRKTFGLSKGAYKRLLGGLMKEGRVEVTYHGVRLL